MKRKKYVERQEEEKQAIYPNKDVSIYPAPSEVKQKIKILTSAA